MYVCISDVKPNLGCVIRKYQYLIRDIVNVITGYIQEIGTNVLLCVGDCSKSFGHTRDK